MDEGGKNILIMVLAILTIIFFVTSISSCLANRRQKTERDREMALRMDLEEKMSKFVQEKAKWDEKIKEIGRLTEEEKAAHELTKKALSQEQLINKSLKEELEKVKKLKETLEEDLKEALVHTPKKSSSPR